MEAKLLANLGKISGIAGISIGILFFLFRGVLQYLGRSEGLAPDQAYVIVITLMVMTFGAAVLGLITWIIVGRQKTITNLGILSIVLMFFAVLTSIIIIPIIIQVKTTNVNTATASSDQNDKPVADSEKNPSSQAETTIRTIQTSYDVCVGEHPERCPPNAVFLTCGSSVQDWASKICLSSKIQKLSDRSGNKCGYYVAKVDCVTQANN